MKPPKVIALCTVGAGLNSIDGVLMQGGKIDHIIGVNPNSASFSSISGYVDVADFANKRGIGYDYALDYNLLDPNNKVVFSKLVYDLVWVTGWQRLIPTWLIESCKYGAIGGHGSPDGINGGRGRSPQNWAIMLGCQTFDLSLFRISNGIDDGDVIANRSFEYTQHDTIATSYQKASLCMSEMVADVLKSPDRIFNAQPQTGEPFYFPQRKPHDGVVDWTLNSSVIFSHCRALTRPYPGLITFRDELKIIIWKCIPFDKQIGEIGKIEHVFNNGEFLVGCGDGRLLVQEYETDQNWFPIIDEQLVGQNYSVTLSEILKRHREKFPNHKISPRIIELLNE